MKENYLFRDRPNSGYQVPPQYSPDGQMLQPGILKPMPPVDIRPVHGTSLTLGILALVLSFPMAVVSLVLGIAGRISGENHDLSHNITAGKICCNTAFALAGCRILLTLIVIILTEML